MNRQALLTRDLMQHREHQAETIAFARRNVPQIVRAALAGIAMQQRPSRIRGASDTPAPAPRWLVYTLAVSWSLTMTVVAWELATKLIPWLREMLS